MIFKVKATDLETGNAMIAYRCATHTDALNVCKELNRLNSEAARLTGKVIRFVYSVIISR